MRSHDFTCELGTVSCRIFVWAESSSQHFSFFTRGAVNFHLGQMTYIQILTILSKLSELYNMKG